MFNDTTDVIFGAGGLLLSAIGMSADGVFAVIAAIASAANAVFLLIRLVCRFVVACKKRKMGVISDVEFITEIEHIAGDAEQLTINIEGDKNDVSKHD